MKNPILLAALCLLFCLPTIVSAQDKDELDTYIKRLKDDLAGPRNETGFLSAGSDFLYGQEYFEVKNYSSAARYFMDVVNKQKDNAFANYQLALSLILQNNAAKKKQAQEYLDHAFQLNASLKERYNKDVPSVNEDVSVNDKITIEKKPAGNKTSAGLDAYIAALKYSRDTRGPETAMNTAGHDAMYGIEYFEVNEFRSAEISFALSLAKDPDNPYVNYLTAVAMAVQGKKDATKHLQKAVEKDPTLVNRYPKDLANATTAWKKNQSANTIKPAKPSTTLTKGGALVYGKYSCSQSVWNGPNVSPAYSFQYKGYFELKSNGTYRWLDNGGTGSYKYDVKTGNVTWLSGHFKTSGAKSSQYQAGKESVQINVKFSESNTWICGCKK